MKMRMKVLVSICLSVCLILSGFMSEGLMLAEKANKSASQETLAAVMKSYGEKLRDHYFGDVLPGFDQPEACYVEFSLLRAGIPMGNIEKTKELLVTQGKELANAGEITCQDGKKKKEAEIFAGKYAINTGLKVSLLVTALGMDARNIGGYDLIEVLARKTVYEESTFYIREATLLLALDCGNYELPVGEKYLTREDILKVLLEDLDKQIANAAKFGADTLAMTIQPLEKYKNHPIYGKQITEKLEESLIKLDSLQNSDGHFAQEGKSNIWSLAQVMIAMGENHISPFSEDLAGRKYTFQKNDKTVLDAAFSLIESEEKMAECMELFQPDQILRGLVSLFIAGKDSNRSLYQMGTVGEIEPPKETMVPAKETATPKETEASFEQTPVPDMSVKPMENSTQPTTPGNGDFSQQNEKTSSKKNPILSIVSVSGKSLKKTVALKKNKKKTITITVKTRDKKKKTTDAISIKGKGVKVYRIQKKTGRLLITVKISKTGKQNLVVKAGKLKQRIKVLVKSA